MITAKKAAVLESFYPDLLVSQVDVVDYKATTHLLRCAVLEPFHRNRLSAVAARLTILAHTRVVEDEWCQLLETLHLAAVEELSMIEIRRFAAGINFITR